MPEWEYRHSRDAFCNVSLDDVAGLIAESEARIPTKIDIRPVLERKRDALMAHASQITDSWFSKIPPQVVESAFGHECFIRVRNQTQASVPETDLFDGLR